MFKIKSFSVLKIAKGVHVSVIYCHGLGELGNVSSSFDINKMHSKLTSILYEGVVGLL